MFLQACLYHECFHEMSSIELGQDLDWNKLGFEGHRDLGELGGFWRFKNACASDTLQLVARRFQRAMFPHGPLFSMNVSALELGKIQLKRKRFTCDATALKPNAAGHMNMVYTCLICLSRAASAPSISQSSSPIWTA